MQILKTSYDKGILNCIIEHPESKNALSQVLMNELHQVFKESHNYPECRIIVIAGSHGYFCTGMDFKSFAHGEFNSLATEQYMTLLKEMTQINKVIIAKVEGQVLAGGMGLMSACDFVLSTPQSQFGLPEGLWGLLPANVIPFLIRRVGFQPAYRMALSTMNLSANEALKIHLVDEMAEELTPILHKYTNRMLKLTPETISHIKSYFRNMWIINEAMEASAVQKLNELVLQPEVVSNIRRFVDTGKFPWEKGKSL